MITPNAQVGWWFTSPGMNLEQIESAEELEALRAHELWFSAWPNLETAGLRIAWSRTFWLRWFAD